MRPHREAETEHDVGDRPTTRPCYDVEAFARNACGDRLSIATYLRRLGSLSAVPMVAAPRERLLDLPLDHRSGFVLAHVDGVSSYEVILDVCGMPAEEGLRELYALLEAGVIVSE